MRIYWFQSSCNFSSSIAILVIAMEEHFSITQSVLWMKKENMSNKKILQSETNKI